MAPVAGFSRGRAHLLKVLERTRVEYVAARCRVTASAVYNWTSGRRTPCRRVRKLLSVTYRIPAKSWDEPEVSPEN